MAGGEAKKLGGMKEFQVLFSPLCPSNGTIIVGLFTIEMIATAEATGGGVLPVIADRRKSAIGVRH